MYPKNEAMKARLIILIVTSFLTMGVSAQSMQKSNAWSGKLKVFGNELTLVFHLNADSCTLDSPDQGVKGVPAKLETTTDGIKVADPTINALYEGTYDADSIKGTFKLHGFAFPLTLRKCELKRHRPQTPVAPFPYQTEEVSFSNGTAVLQGKLVMPKDCSRHTPVLLMLTGSGLQNRDEEIFEHKPFAVIADALSETEFALNHYEEAINYVDRAIQLEREEGREAKLRIRLAQKATILAGSGKRQEAVEIFDSIIPYFRTTGNHQSLAISLNKAGQALLEIGNTNEAKQRQAAAYFRESARLCREMGS